MPAWHQLHNAPEEEDHPSESRPYKQYCTTLLTLVKAEATLIGSRPRGDGDETDFLSESSSLRPHQEREGVRSTYHWLLDWSKPWYCASVEDINLMLMLHKNTPHQSHVAKVIMLLTEDSLILYTTNNETKMLFWLPSNWDLYLFFANKKKKKAMPLMRRTDIS